MHVYVCAHAHDWAFDAHVTSRPYVYDAVCMRGLMCMQCMGWEEHLHIHGTYNIWTRRESFCTELSYVPDCTFGPGGSVDLRVQDTVTGDTCTHVVLSGNLARRFL